MLDVQTITNDLLWMIYFQSAFKTKPQNSKTGYVSILGST